MNVFITGSNGFIGKSLTPYLKSKKLNVIAATRDLYGDFTNQNNWELFLTSVDTVIHLAARVHIMNDNALNPDEEFQKMNVDSTLRLASAAKKVGVKRFIFLSSIKVNGEETHSTPFTAHDTPRPEDSYGRSKHNAEVGLMMLHSPGVFEVVIIRPPLIYGPGVRANFLNLMKMVSRDIPLPFLLVNNKRSLVSVFNLCDLIYTCTYHPKASGEIFLVKDKMDYSLKNIIDEIAKTMNKTPHLLPVPVSIMKFGFNIIGKKSFSDRLLGNLQVDIAKNKELLNWEPPFSFQETFKEIDRSHRDS